MNINPQTFQDYGSIIYDDFNYTCIKNNIRQSMINEKTIVCKKINSLKCVKNTNVIIDIINGTALLCISTNEASTNIQFFYLDKTVMLNPGIYYQIIALYGTCKIKSAIKAPFNKQTISLNSEITPLLTYPKIDISKINTLFYQEKELGFVFKGEKHDFWELTYVDKGSMYTNISGKEYLLKQGELIFYGENQFHTQWADKNTSVCFITISFNMDFEDSKQLTDKIFTIDNELKKLLKKILKEKENHNHYSSDLILCYLKELIIKLVRCEKFEDALNNLNTDIQENIENSIVKNTIEFIHNNIHTKITIPEIAQSIPISPSYLSTIFKKHMKVTLVDYINTYRLEKSKDLIRTTNFNITEISNLLGYKTVHYFSRQFKATFDISPSAYSKSIHK
jgi:AraC-like DNA-binding protein